MKIPSDICVSFFIFEGRAFLQWNRKQNRKLQKYRH